MTNSELRQSSKEKVHGKAGKVIGRYLIYMLISFAISFLLGIISGSINIGIINFILQIAVSIIELGFSYGLIISVLKIYRNESTSLTEFIPLGFNYLGRYIKLQLSLIVKLLIPIFIVLFGYVLILLAIFMKSSGGLFFTLIGLVLIIFGYVKLLLKTYLFVLSDFLRYDNPEATSKEVLNKSAELMKGKRFQYFCLSLSIIAPVILIGLALVIIGSFTNVILLPILGALVLTIGYFVKIPHLIFAMINFYEDTANIATSPVVDVQSEIM